MSAHTSIWSATAPMPERGPLSDDLHADVCIVGAGIAGLSTAYALAQAGDQVVVLDDGPLAGGQTQMTTAHLASAMDDRLYRLEHLHGLRGMRLAWESHAAAIDRIEEIVRREGIDCDFTRLDGYLFLAPHDTSQTLDFEFAAAH